MLKNGTQIYCTVETRNRMKVLARMEGRTLSGWLTMIATSEKKRVSVTEYRKARREVFSGQA